MGVAAVHLEPRDLLSSGTFCQSDERPLARVDVTLSRIYGSPFVRRQAT